MASWLRRSAEGQQGQIQADAGHVMAPRATGKNTVVPLLTWALLKEIKTYKDMILVTSADEVDRMRRVLEAWDDLDEPDEGTGFKVCSYSNLKITSLPADVVVFLDVDVHWPAEFSAAAAILGWSLRVPCGQFRIISMSCEPFDDRLRGVLFGDSFIQCLVRVNRTFAFDYPRGGLMHGDPSREQAHVAKWVVEGRDVVDKLTEQILHPKHSKKHTVVCFEAFEELLRLETTLGGVEFDSINVQSRVNPNAAIALREFLEHEPDDDGEIARPDMQVKLVYLDDAALRGICLRDHHVWLVLPTRRMAVGFDTQLNWLVREEVPQCLDDQFDIESWGLRANTATVLQVGVPRLNRSQRTLRSESSHLGALIILLSAYGSLDKDDVLQSVVERPRAAFEMRARLLKQKLIKPDYSCGLKRVQVSAFKQVLPLVGHNYCLASLVVAAMNSGVVNRVKIRLAALMAAGVSDLVEDVATVNADQAMRCSGSYTSNLVPYGTWWKVLGVLDCTDPGCLQRLAGQKTRLDHLGAVVNVKNAKATIRNVQLLDGIMVSHKMPVAGPSAGDRFLQDGEVALLFRHLIQAFVFNLVIAKRDGEAIVFSTISGGDVVQATEEVEGAAREALDASGRHSRLVALGISTSLVRAQDGQIGIDAWLWVPDEHMFRWHRDDCEGQGFLEGISFDRVE